jgi:hypothetical protein
MTFDEKQQEDIPLNHKSVTHLLRTRRFVVQIKIIGKAENEKY